MPGQESPEQRIIIVSNRLPFTVTIRGQDLSFEQSGGGLVSGLSAWLETLGPMHGYKYSWVGWPGVTVPPGLKGALESVADSRFSSHPVYLSDQEMENFYQGFCNMTVWPLFHYFQSFVAYDNEYWATYRRVNQAFCDAVLQIARPGDIVWVHDYHLMLLPGLLREHLPDTPIGFFLHIPFPNYELFRLMPREWGEEILNGLLGADLVGFHSKDYTEHFISTAQRILPTQPSSGGILAGKRIAEAGTYPMGIDYEKYSGATRSEEVRQARSDLKDIMQDSKVILSIDRLDYTKGIVNRLRGYELFLDQNPEWRGKVVLALVATPSRVGVQHYADTKQQIEALVGHINGRFGNIGWVPIRYQYAFMSLLPLVTLYSASDVALVTPLRDGMNLVSKEYLACRAEGTGVLILSIFAGAASELTESILINPNSIEEIAAALRTALEMPTSEQIRRNRIMQHRLREYDVTPWAQRFIRDLLRTSARRLGIAAANSANEVEGSSGPSSLSPTSVERERASERHRFIHKDGVIAPLPHPSKHKDQAQEATMDTSSSCE